MFYKKLGLSDHTSTLLKGKFCKCLKLDVEWKEEDVVKRDKVDESDKEEEEEEEERREREREMTIARPLIYEHPHSICP